MIFTSRGLFLGFHDDLKKPRTSGQIAVIITLVIVVIFLLLLVFVNIAKTSLIKTLTSQLTDKAALGLASKLGTSSYKLYLYMGLPLPPGPPPYQICNINWWAVAFILGGLVAAILFTPLFGVLGWISLIYVTAAVSAGLVGYGAIDAILSSAALDQAIRTMFAQDMDAYSSLRESALYDVVSVLAMDDTMVLNKGGGVFSDEENHVYDCSSVEKVRKLNRVGRFYAWYYSKRIPLIIPVDPNKEINNFITGLQQYIDIDIYDNVTWAITRASFTVEPASSGDGSALSVSCGSSCPPWVADASSNRVRVVTIDESQRDTLVPPADGHYLDLGFLSAKLLSLGGLLLQKGYSPLFCQDSTCSCIPDSTCISGTDALSVLVDDLTMFVARSKAVLELPVSRRLQEVSNWLPFFYDLEYTYTTAGGDHDIYDRLTRDEIDLTAWINGLVAIDTQLKVEIPQPNGNCGYGLGGSVSECATVLCCASDSSGNCTSSCEACGTSPCTWEGTYCSCTDVGGNPPVCQPGVGDLYGANPAWCPLLDNTPACACPCAPGPLYADVNACYFQGQLSQDAPSGFTEPEQALAILAALKEDITELKVIISTFAQAMQKVLYEEDDPNNPLKKVLFYAWQDKKQHYHAVAAQMDPYIKGLPNITHQSHWFNIQNCVVLQNATGQFELQAYYYDEDVTTPSKTAPVWWTLRYRKQPDQPEFNKAFLQTIVKDIQDNGQFTSSFNVNNADNLRGNYSITSKTRGFYGVNKSDIRIERP